MSTTYYYYYYYYGRRLLAAIVAITLFLLLLQHRHHYEIESFIVTPSISSTTTITRNKQLSIISGSFYKNSHNKNEYRTTRRWLLQQNQRELYHHHRSHSMSSLTKMSLSISPSKLNESLTTSTRNTASSSSSFPIIKQNYTVPTNPLSSGSGTTSTNTKNDDEIQVSACIELPFSSNIAYDAFQNVTRQPSWSPWLKSVEYADGNVHSDISVWTVGIMGLKFSWKARHTINDKSSGIIEWQSESGLRNRGKVQFINQNNDKEYIHPEDIYDDYNDDDVGSCTMYITMCITPPKLIMKLFSLRNTTTNKLKAVQNLIQDKMLNQTVTLFRQVVYENDVQLYKQKKRRQKHLLLLNSQDYDYKQQQQQQEQRQHQYENDQAQEQQEKESLIETNTMQRREHHHDEQQQETKFDQYQQQGEETKFHHNHPSQTEVEEKQHYHHQHLLIRSIKKLFKKEKEYYHKQLIRSIKMRFKNVMKSYTNTTTNNKSLKNKMPIQGDDQQPSFLITKKHQPDGENEVQETSLINHHHQQQQQHRRSRVHRRLLQSIKQRLKRIK